ncbi:MAG: M55 family metallopeptidase [Lentisphaerota bacterium]
MHVYIQFDFEGISGFVIRDNIDRNIPTVLERTKRLMKIATAEVSAAADGVFAAGATEVTIWDSHGDGNTLLVEELTERARLITGEYERGPWLHFFDNADIGIYIGGHGMDGTPGAVTPHTIITVNGVNYGEVGMFVNCCGSRNIPVVLVSGDSAVLREVNRQIPGGEFVVTKEAIGPTLARTITPKSSCKRIFDAAKRGVEKSAGIKPFKLKSPFRINCPTLNPPQADFVYDKDGDFCNAYRSFLKERLGYEKGWPEYDLRETKEGQGESVS